MRRILSVLILLFLIQGCKVTYLETQGTIVDVSEESIVIMFFCATPKKPDCQGWATYSKESFPNAYLGQTVQIK
jgi:hypothetical protein